MQSLIFRIFQEMKKNDFKSKLKKLQHEVTTEEKRARLSSKNSLTTDRNASSRVQSAFTRDPSSLGSARIDTSRPLTSVGGQNAVKIATSLGHIIPHSAPTTAKPLPVQISSHCNVLMSLLNN